MPALPIFDDSEETWRGLDEAASGQSPL
jgi:hypothetical protein